MNLGRMAATFFRIGATGFGGPMALIALMEQHLVEKSEAVTPDDFAEGVAIGQILPGPVAVDCATHVGYRLHGLRGAIVSSCALVAPPFLLMLVLTPLYLRYGRVPEAKAFFVGVAPAVVAVVLAAGWRMGRKGIKDWPSVAIALLACAGLMFRVQPVLLIVVAGAIGMLIRGIGRRSGGKGEPVGEGAKT